MFEEELASIPAQPPRSGVLPGMRLAAALPRSTLIVLLALVVLFAIFPLSIISADPKAKLAIGPNRTVEGRVLSVTDVAGCRGGAARRLLYTFSAPSGSEFHGVALLCAASPYYSSQAGDSIEIRYLRRDPAVNAPAGSDQAAPPILPFMFFPLFFLLLLAPLYLPQLREVMRARRLYRDGALRPGEVVFVKKRNALAWPGWPAGSMADVYVAYQSPAGTRAETVVWCMNDWLVNQLAPGARVHVLLAPDDTARGALLEAFIR